jgi:hypothetical protein
VVEAVEAFDALSAGLDEDAAGVEDDSPLPEAEPDSEDFAAGAVPDFEVDRESVR